MAWDISDAVLLQSTSTTRSNSCIFIKPDGTKLYSIGDNNKTVQEYDLSTPWDITTISYLQQLDVSATITIGAGIFFSPDGLKMYILETFFNVYEFHEYDLSIAWDITSAAYLQSSPTKLGYYRSGLFFSPDGLKVYFFNSNNFTADEDTIFQYDLSIAWDISTAVYIQNFLITTTLGGLTPSSVFFKPDGLKMYFVYAPLTLYEYDLSVAWDVSTATPSKELVVTKSLVFFKPDGLKLYLAELLDVNIDEYDVITTTVLLSPGHWHNTHFPKSHWNDNHWQNYGTIGLTYEQIFIISLINTSISHTISQINTTQTNESKSNTTIELESKFSFEE